ncbi:MAG: CDP-diacylglycerol--serine O-phosphatidyltransferase, partial [Polyangiaceae bacterium]
MAFRRPRRNPNRVRPKLDLRKTLFVLPNLITLGSVFCGFNAILAVAKDQPTEKDVYGAAVL